MSFGPYEILYEHYICLYSPGPFLWVPISILKLSSPKLGTFWIKSIYQFHFYSDMIFSIVLCVLSSVICACEDMSICCQLNSMDEWQEKSNMVCMPNVKR